MIAGLTLAPFISHISDVASHTAQGSRSVLLIALPFLVAILLSGTHPPQGVTDTEVNWIVAILCGGGALTALALLAYRIPTTAQFWRVDLLGLAVWAAFVSTVLAGARFVVRMWDLWLVIAACASPVPILLVGALFGGGDLALAVLACGFSAIVVLRVARRCDVRRRWAGTALSFAAGASAAAVALWMIPDRQIGLIAAVATGAGLIPLITARTLLRVGPTSPGADHPRQTLELTVGAVGGVLALALIMLVAYPHPQRFPPPPTASAIWLTDSGLRRSANYDFATSVLGPDATFTRYLPLQPTSVAAAVDVIFTPNPGALEDFADASWYRSHEPVDYSPANLSPRHDLVVRSSHTHADLALSPDSPQWYLLTWGWRVPGGYQQVIVVASQGKDRGLPAPSRPSLSQSLLDPALWISRQQRKETSDVPARTIEVAHKLASQLIATGLGGVGPGA